MRKAKVGRRRKPQEPEKMTNVGVELRDSIRRRLKVYVAQEDITQKSAINEAIDEYLKARGA